MAFFSPEELEKIGFKTIGKDVLIDQGVQIFGASRISIGDNVRIDYGTILSPGSGRIIIGNHIHIAPYVLIYGEGGVTIEDFVGISSRCALYSASDDYSGMHLIGPIISEKYLKVDVRPIFLSRLSSVGTNSTILPGGFLSEGAVLGAHSVLSKTIPKWEIWVGSPSRFLMKRKSQSLTLADSFQNEYFKL